MPTNLREILNAFRAGERGLPNFRECCEIAAKIDLDYQNMCIKEEELSAVRAQLQAAKAYAHQLERGMHHSRRDTIAVDVDAHISG